MTAWIQAIVGRVRELARRDPERRRFGAAAHGYALRPPLAPAQLAPIEAALGTALPAPYREFLAVAGEGGPGPGYGLSRLAHPIQLDGGARPFTVRGALLPPASAPDDDPYWSPRHLDGTVLLADHGCGYTTVLVVAPGPAHGRVYADLRGAGIGLVPTHEDFVAWYESWIEQASAEPPRTVGLAPSSRCAPPNALGNFLAQVEQREGVAPGELSETTVRDALRKIGDGGIATRCGAGERFFAEGDPVRPCINCAAMVSRFVARDMMRPAQIVPGLPPLPDREDPP